MCGNFNSLKRCQEHEDIRQDINLYTCKSQREWKTFNDCGTLEQLRLLHTVLYYSALYHQSNVL